jgi:alpha-beta hydrolase superfamily lysophospholipase
MIVTEHTVDVSDDIGLAGQHEISAIVAEPEAPGASRGLLVCLPGGTFTREYFHPPTDLPGYSFAEYMANRGYATMLIDPLGVGASSRPPDGEVVTAEVTARANQSALRQIIDLQSHAPAVTIGVGHSLGGQLTIVQQAAFKEFDAIAILGWSNLGLERHGATTDVLAGQNVENGYLSIDRSSRRHLFHEDDVPEALLEAERTMSAPVSIPLFRTTMEPGIVADAAGTVTTPVFLAFGARDVSSNPHAEVPTYGSSSDVSLFVMANSAHCHNFASTRERLFSRLATWCDHLPELD